MNLLLLIILNLFNLQTFSAQSQPAKTSSWWSWAPVAGAAAALAGTGVAYHYYKKYEKIHKETTSQLESFEEPISKQENEIDTFAFYYTKLNIIRQLSSHASIIGTKAQRKNHVKLFLIDYPQFNY